MSPRLLYWLDDEIFISGNNQTQQTTTGFLTITTYKIFELSSLGYRKFLVYYVLVVVVFLSFVWLMEIKEKWKMEMSLRWLPKRLLTTNLGYGYS